MSPMTAQRCPACGYANDAASLSCGMCGAVLQRTDSGHVELPSADRSAGREEPICGLRPTVFFLVAGAVLAPVFTFTPLLQRMGWFLCSLIHEMGHTIAALLVGCSAFPAIRLDGHAMTQHGQQHTVLVLATWAACGWLAWRFRRTRRLCITFGVCAVLYPAIAFTWMKEVVHLLGGHVGELVFAAVFFWRALSGGFTNAVSERIAYATCAWYFVACNVWLTGGLIFSLKIQHWYANSGSFGLTNDYIRLAGVLGWRLPAVAAGMLAMSLVVLPATLVVCRLQAAERS